MQTLLGEFVQSIVDFPGAFVDVAARGPIQAILVVMGALLVGVASAVLGYLTLGALVELLTPDLSGRSPPRAGR